jgi:hypothetical protein
VLEAMEDLLNGAAYSATDWLHRRTALPLGFRGVMGGTAIEVRTNSRLFADAIRGLMQRDSSLRLGRAARWEIEVEVQIHDEASMTVSHGEDGCERFSFGPSCSIRMGDGSWFAFTPPCIDGVGFVFVAGGEDYQAKRLRSFLASVVEFVQESVSERNCCLARDEAMA